MERPDFDVIVAGAGAGGAAAAYYLKQAGFRVLVVEKAHLPRYKACGGAVPRSALEQFPFSFASVIEALPTEARFCFPGLAPVDVALPDQPVAMVMRHRFDAFLLACSDAEVLDGVAIGGVIEDDGQVQVEVGNRTLTARYLVGADGALSQVARSLGLRRRRRPGGTVAAEVPMHGREVLAAEYGSRAVFVLGAAPWGYAWVFPKGGVLSVGIACFRPGRADLRTALRREMGQLGIDLTGVPLHGHALPCYQTLPWARWPGQAQDRLSTRRCLLVGDAAGLVDPLFGEGIRYAITSARLAAEAIALENVASYDVAVWQEIGHSLAAGVLAANVFYRWPRFCFQQGVSNPATIRHFLNLLAGEADYPDIGRRVVASTAGWLLWGRGKTDKQTLVA